MSRDNRILAVRMTDEYADFIAKVGDSLRESGGKVSPTAAAIVEACVNLVGKQHGLDAPKRLPIGSGGKRAGSGRRKTAKPG